MNFAVPQIAAAQRKEDNILVGLNDLTRGSSALPRNRYFPRAITFRSPVRNASATTPVV